MAKRDLIFNNFSWKLASLILATGVWFTFHSGNKVDLPMPDDMLNASGTRTLFHIPVSVLKTANDHREYQLVPGQVDLELGGPSSELRGLIAADLHVLVDLRDGGEGPMMVSVTPPAGVRIERITPLSINVQLVKP